MSTKKTNSNCTETTHNGIKYKHKYSIDEFKDIKNILLIIERQKEGRFEYLKDYRYRNCDDKTLVLPEHSKHREMIINSKWLEEYRKRKYKHSIPIQLPSNENVIIRNERNEVIIPEITIKTIKIKKNKIKLELENLMAHISDVKDQKDIFEMRFNQINSEFIELKIEFVKVNSENIELKTEIVEVKLENIKLKTDLDELEESFSQITNIIQKKVEHVKLQKI